MLNMDQSAWDVLQGSYKTGEGSKLLQALSSGMNLQRSVWSWTTWITSIIISLSSISISASFPFWSVLCLSTMHQIQRWRYSPDKISGDSPFFLFSLGIFATPFIIQSFFPFSRSYSGSIYRFSSCSGPTATPAWGPRALSPPRPEDQGPSVLGPRVGRGGGGEQGLALKN